MKQLFGWRCVYTFSYWEPAWFLHYNSLKWTSSLADALFTHSVIGNLNVFCISAAVVVLLLCLSRLLPSLSVAFALFALHFLSNLVSLLLKPWRHSKKMISFQCNWQALRGIEDAYEGQHIPRSSICQGPPGLFFEPCIFGRHLVCFASWHPYPTSSQQRIICNSQLIKAGLQP